MCPAVFAFLDPSPSMLLMLGLLAVLLFGERLPEVASTFGKRLMELKKGMHGIQQEIKGAIESAANPSSDTYTASPYDEASHYAPPEATEVATAPKFEPPPQTEEATAPKFQPPGA